MDMMKKADNRFNILRDASIFSSSSYIARIMFFIRGFLNAKILGPTSYGLWTALNIVLNLSYYLNLGSIEAMGREISLQKGMSSEKGMQKARNSIFTFCLIVNFIFSFTLIILTFALWSKFSSIERAGVITVAFLSFAFFVQEFYQSALISLKKFSLIGTANIIFSILTVIMTILLVPTLKIYGVYIVTISVSLFSVAYLMFRAAYNLKLYFDFKEMFRLIKIGFPLMSIDFLETVMVSITGLIVLFLLGKVSLGYYSVALLGARFLMYFQESIGRVFEPYIYQRYGETHEISRLKAYLLKPTSIMVLLFPVFIVFYYTVVTFLIRYLLPDYTVSIYPFFIILTANFLRNLSPTSFAFIIAVNKQRFLVPAYLIAIVVVSMASFIFVNMGFGILGVAFGFLLASFFVGSITFIYASQHYIKGTFKCLNYLFSAYLPFLYMITATLFSEKIISYSFDIIADIKKLIIKLGVLLIFSIPLIYAANRNTGIVFDLMSFFKSGRLLSRSEA